MKKDYQDPELEIIELSDEDVVTTSDEGYCEGPTALEGGCPLD